MVYECSYCTKLFRRNWNRLRHEQEVHLIRNESVDSKESEVSDNEQIHPLKINLIPRSSSSENSDNESNAESNNSDSYSSDNSDNESGNADSYSSENSDNESNTESNTSSDNSNDDDSSNAETDSSSDNGNRESFWDLLRKDLLQNLQDVGEECNDLINEQNLTRAESKVLLLKKIRKRLFELYTDKVWDYEYMKDDPLHKRIMSNKRRLEKDEQLHPEDALRMVLKRRKREIIQAAGVEDDIFSDNNED